MRYLTAIDIHGNMHIYLSMESPEDDRSFSKNKIKTMGTRTLFEWYRNEISRRTKEELKEDPQIKAIEHEIENRLRELDFKKSNLDEGQKIFL